MSDTAAIHEGFMNGSRMILPRVGGGVREGVGVGEMVKFSTHPQSPLAASAIACEATC